MSIPEPSELRRLAEASPGTVTAWEAAVHEAGHAIASIALGEYPDLIYLNPDSSDDHAGRNTFRGWIGLLDLVTDDPELRRLIAKRRQDLAIVTTAGRVAEDIAFGRRPDGLDFAYGLLDAGAQGGGDEASLLALVTEAGTDDLEGWIADCYDAATNILRQHWGALASLAATLVERQRLTRDDLWEIDALESVERSAVAP